MSSEKNDEKIPEKNNNTTTNNDPEISITKKDGKASSIKASIEMQKEGKNKKRKKIKIRAYCNKCYQFFENGPYTKICRNHLEKDCNLIECQKFKQNGDNPCIRKFPNINSANRHTHCLTKKDIEVWDPKCEIQKCLGKKKESDNKFSDIINDGNENNDKNINYNKNEKKVNKNNTSSSNISNSFLNEINNNNSLLNMNLNLNNNLFSDNSYSFLDNNNSNCFINNNNNVIELIEDIEKFHFNENDNKNLNNNFDVRLIEDIEKIHFTENDNFINNNDSEEKNNFNKTNLDDKNEKQNIINEEIKDKDKDKSKENNKDKDKEIKEENKEKDKDKEKKEENKTSAIENIEKIENESIEDFFEKVQKETNIPNNIKKKLVNAFKKKGIFNVKILLLFYEKHKNWDFLIEKFKNISSQIEGVALYIEFLLKLH